MRKKIALEIALTVLFALITVALFSILRRGGGTKFGAEFIFHDGEGPNQGAFSRELGINTIPIFLDHAWVRIEPANNQWNWGDELPSNTGDYDHTMVRIAALHMLAWNSDELPAWVDKNDIDGEFKEQYGEFVRAAVEQIKQRNIHVDVYLVELEANFAGHEIAGKTKTNAWIIEWIKWEVEIIKSIDPSAKIVIPLTPTEFRPEEPLTNSGDLGKILVSDFVNRMIQASVQFDAFGFSISSGAYDKIDDWTTLQTVLDRWTSTIDKEIFVWAMGYPANNDGNLSFHNPRPGGYSEAWQEEQYANSFRLLLSNPKVIGVSIDLFDFQEPELASPWCWGLVGGDWTRPETLYKRPSFDAVKEIWQDNKR